MDDVAAYDLINRRFIGFAEEQGIQITPTLGRREKIVLFGEPVYDEFFGGSRPDARWFTIGQNRSGDGERWDTLGASFFPPHTGEFPHMKVFSPRELEDCLPILWAMRCAWFNFAVSVEEAERAVLRLVG